VSITGIVEKDTIKLPPGIHLPDGTTVLIQTETGMKESAPAKKGNALAWMKEFVGCIDTLPEDLAAEHDHYIHGTPKRGEK
jgi:hypothetical protein